MKILSLFDGMSCGMIAFVENGIQVNRYVAYEIDKHAVKTSSHNFPIIEQKGDVFNADFTEYQDFDFVIGGSPCTYWSIAQTKNRETVASGMGWDLFSQYVRAINEAKPRYFIYENNKSMSKEIRRCITETFGFEPIEINSALVSAQNRQRLYWVGVKQHDGTYARADLTLPKDRGILLRDVLDNNCTSWLEKSQTVDASYGKASNGTNPFNGKQSGRRIMVAEPLRIGTMPSPDGNLKGGQGMRVYSEEGKLVPITTGKTKTGFYAVPYLTEENVKNLMRPFGAKGKICTETDKSHTLNTQTGGGNGVYYAEPINTIDGKGEKSKTMLSGYHKFGIATFVTHPEFNGGTTAVAEPVGCICHNIKQEVTVLGIETKEFDDFITVFETKDGVFEKADRCYDSNGKMWTITTSPNDKIIASTEPTERKDITVYEIKDGKITVKGKQYPIKLKDGNYIIRKLTVTECKRLQTVPDWYEFPVSNTQAYKMLGNGWTIDVIRHLINCALNTEIPEERVPETLFDYEQMYIT